MVAGRTPPTRDRQPPLQVSRLLGFGALLDAGELEALVAALPGVHFYATGAVLRPGSECMGRAAFCQAYHAYLQAVQDGREWTLPTVSASISPDCLYTMVARTNSVLVRPCRPVIQIRPHSVSYSVADGKFRSMVRGETAIAWGLYFSYPQLFQDPESGDIVRVDEKFVNTAPFRGLQRWIRYNTRATPFVVGGRRINVPVRIGSIEWIHRHPQLLTQGIEVGL